MTRALLLLALLAVPAAAWDLGESGAVEERAGELRRYWRPFNKTMVDLDMVKRTAQDEEPDWVTREKEKMTPRERPFGRLAGFTLRRDDVRLVIVGRHGPLTPGLKDGEARKERLAALRAAEGAAADALWEAMVKDGDAGLQLASSAPGRDAYASDRSSDAEPLRVVWHPLDFYRDQGKGGELYVLLYADKPRAGAAAPAAADGGGKAAPPAARRPLAGFEGR